jgi:hypothetical protein
VGWGAGAAAALGAMVWERSDGQPKIGGLE